MRGPKRSKVEEVTPEAAAARRLDCKTFDGAADITMSSSSSAAPAGTPFAPVASASGGCINQVPQGNSGITRVGRRIKNIAVQLKVQLESSNPGGGSYNMTSLYLLWDKAPNKPSALPGWTTIFNAQTPTALLNTTNAGRFVVLKEWNWTQSVTAPGGNWGPMHVNEVIDLNGDFVTLWNETATTGLYTSMLTGALLVYVVTSNAELFPVVSSRIYFEDV